MRTISVAAAALLLAAACSSAPSGQSAISGQPEDDSPATTTTVAPVATTTSTTTTTVAPEDDSPAKPAGWKHPNCAKVIAAERAAQEEEGRAWVFRDAGIDADNDGLIGSDEHYLGTNPDNPDSDGDGFSDGEECRNGTNPLLFALMDPDDPAYLEPKAAD